MSTSYPRLRRNVLLIRLRKPRQDMRTDSGQDFGHCSPAEHVWTPGEMALLKRDSVPDGFQPPLQSINVKRCIAAAALRDLEETHWLRELAEKYDFVKGLVGWAGLCLAVFLEQWKVDGFGRCRDVVLEAFTPDRLALGSDWSVCIVSGDDASTTEVVIDFARQFQTQVLPGMLDENCARPIGFTSVLFRSSQ